MDDESDVRVDEDPDRGEFVLRVDGVEAGHVSVRRRRGHKTPGAIVLIHTEVDEAYGGRGLAGRLVQGGVRRRPRRGGRRRPPLSLRAALAAHPPRVPGRRARRTTGCSLGLDAPTEGGVVSDGENGPEIDPHAQPSGTGCVERDATGGWWFRLRRCAACGRIGCCDSSPGQRATRHARNAGRPILTASSPARTGSSSTATGRVPGPALAGPRHHPANQGTPGPTDRVPAGLAAPTALTPGSYPVGPKRSTRMLPSGWPASTSRVSIAPVKRAEPHR